LGGALVEQKAGYLPEGLLNFVVLLGWNPKDPTEFMSLEQMAQLVRFLYFYQDRSGRQ
jgi:hypothetical protein